VRPPAGQMMFQSRGPPTARIHGLHACISVFGKPDEMDTDDGLAGVPLEPGGRSFKRSFVDDNIEGHRTQRTSSCWKSGGSDGEVLKTRAHKTTQQCHLISSPMTMTRMHNTFDDGSASITSLLVRNIPSHCTTVTFMDELKSEGFRGVYNFFYRPVHHQTGAVRSFAFLNFATPLIATAFYLKFNGMFLKSAREGEEPLVVLAAVQQGLVENRTYYAACTPKSHRKFRVHPIEPIVDGNRVREMENCARQILLDQHC